MVDKNKEQLFTLLAGDVGNITSGTLFVATSQEKVISNLPINTDELSPCNQEEADTCLFLHVKHAAQTPEAIICIYAFMFTKKSQKEVKFKRYCNILSQALKTSKNNYYKTFFNENKNNIKLTWTGIKSIINNKRGKEDVASTITHEKKRITDSKQIAELFNQYFGTIAEKTKTKICKTPQILQ